MEFKLTVKKEFVIALAADLMLILSWFIGTHSFYSYNRDIFIFGDQLLFPSITWFFGLFVVYLFFRASIIKLKFTPLIAFMTTTFLYWAFLLTSEATAYHIFNVKNAGTAAYPGLPICDCIHAPWWMQLGYLAAGPAYIIIVVLVFKLNKQS